VIPLLIGDMILFYREIDKQEEGIRSSMAIQVKISRMAPVSLLVITLLGMASCDIGGFSRAMLWTDRPEFAFYTEFFNTSQERYKVEVRFFDSSTQKLAEPGEHPDIVAASWLKNSSTRTLFKPLDSIFSKDGLEQSAFYSRLLALGRIEKDLYLLPVSFNIPAIIFTPDSSRVSSNPFTIEMAEMKDHGEAYNRMSGGVYTRMGFSPSFSDEFLFLTAVLYGASFREASPIAWDPQALGQSIAWIQQWIYEANTSIQMEEDFAFKYLHNPPDRLVNSGRTLYMYMDSSDYFTLPEERRRNLDFRWFAAKETIPLDECIVYYGIHKKAKSKNAAKAFTKWFFKPETQKLLMEASKSKKLSETSFGIAGGFSAMRTVTEQIFPQFYPDLLGHIPPENYLYPPNNLPRNWIDIKERVLVPYLRERIRLHVSEDVRSLERRITDWYRLNRE